MSETIKKLLKTKFENWNGLLSLLEGGWRILPVRIDPKNISIKDVTRDKKPLNIVSREIKDALKKYHFKICNAERLSMTYDGTLIIKMKDKR